MRHTFSYKFYVAVGTLCFPLPCCHRLDNRKFGTWNLVLNNPTEKSTLGCERTLSEAWAEGKTHIFPPWKETKLSRKNWIQQRIPINWFRSCNGSLFADMTPTLPVAQPEWGWRGHAHPPTIQTDFLLVLCINFNCSKINGRNSQLNSDSKSVVFSLSAVLFNRVNGSPQGEWNFCKGEWSVT